MRRSYHRAGKSGWGSFAKKVRAVIQQTAEHKFSLTPTNSGALNTITVPVNTYTTFAPLPAIAQGTGVADRIGDKILLRLLKCQWKSYIQYGTVSTDVHTVAAGVQDLPNDFWMHVCRPVKGANGAAQAGLLANVVAFFNTTANRKLCCFYRPNFDADAAGFYIEHTQKVHPGNEFSAYYQFTTGNGAAPNAGKNGYGFGKWQRRYFRPKQLTFSNAVDTLSSNTGWIIVFINNCDPGNTGCQLNVSWQSSAIFTDV